MTKQKILKAKSYLRNRIEVTNMIIQSNDQLQNQMEGLKLHQEELHQCKNLLELINELERVNQTV